MLKKGLSQIEKAKFMAHLALQGYKPKVICNNKEYIRSKEKEKIKQEIKNYL